MSIPKGYRLVPVELLDRALFSIMEQGFKCDGLYELVHIQKLPSQPIYDDAAEQEAFEAVNPMPDQVMKFKGGYAPTGYSAWDAQDFCKKWDGWKQCAQSRAKAGEDE